MLDRLLGREELRERIAELEEERRHMERRLEAEGERRADAQRARQDAEERVNRLEDRIAGLEGRLEERAETGDLSVRRTEELHGERLTEVLDRLQSVSTAPEGALSAMVDDEVPEAVRELLGDRAALVDRRAPCLVYADDAGLVSVTLRPAVAPEPFWEWGDGFRVEPSWFTPEGSEGDPLAHTLALVRADTFAMGRFEGREQVAFEGFSSDVKEQHSKGGFSQRRFERLRDEQIDAHLDRCREALASVVEPLYLVGDRAVIDALDVEADVRRAVDATGTPRDALDRAVFEFWTTRLDGI